MLRKMRFISSLNPMNSSKNDFKNVFKVSSELVTCPYLFASILSKQKNNSILENLFTCFQSGMQEMVELGPTLCRRGELQGEKL